MSSIPQHETAWHALARGYTEARKALDAALTADGLPGLDVFDVLEALQNSTQDMTAKTLQDALELPQYGISRLLDRMEKEGLIARTAHATDRRAKLVHETEKGQAAWMAMSATRQKAFADFFGPRAKPGQLDRMADLLSLLDQRTD